MKSTSKMKTTSKIMMTYKMKTTSKMKTTEKWRQPQKWRRPQKWRWPKKRRRPQKWWEPPTGLESKVLRLERLCPRGRLWWGGGRGRQILSLRGASILNSSILRCLEALEKFVVRWVVVVETSFSVQLESSWTKTLPILFHKEIKSSQE